MLPEVSSDLPVLESEAEMDLKNGRGLDLSPIHDVPVSIQAVLGRASLTAKHLVEISRGKTIELDRRLGEPIDVYMNNRLVARGEIVILDSGNLGITMTEIVKAESK